MKYYLATKRNKLLIYETWTDFKGIRLSGKKKSTSKDYVFYDLIYITF